MEELYEKFGGSVEFIGVNLGVKGEIDDFIKKNGISFPIVYDAGNIITDAYGAQIQTNILIDKQGTVIYKDRGFDKEIGKYLKKLVEGP